MALTSTWSAVIMVLLVTPLMSACTSRESQHQHFRTSPFGAGFETGLAGVRMAVIGNDGEPTMHLRASTGGLRLHDARMIRTGRLRAGQEGHLLEARDGTVRCQLVDEGNAATLSCVDPELAVRAEVDGRYVHVYRDGNPIGRVESEQAGTLALWHEQVEAPQRVLPALSIAVEAEPCTRTLMIRDSAGRHDGRIAGGRWPAEAGALLVGVSAGSPGGVSPEPDPEMAATLAWWVSSRFPAPEVQGCQTSAER